MCLGRVEQWERIVRPTNASSGIQHVLGTVDENGP